MDFVDHVEDIKKSTAGRFCSNLHKDRKASFLSTSSSENDGKEEDEEDVTDWFEEIWPRESQKELIFPVNSHQLVIHQDVKGDTFKASLANTVWEAGWFLNRYFQETSVFPDGFFSGKTVIELGAGTGVVGMTLALLGAEVTLTDLAEALPILQHNVDSNFGAHKEEWLAKEGITVPEVEELTWGQPLSEVLARQSWDIVIGADIIYNATHFEDLAITLEELCQYSSKSYFCHLIRNVEAPFFDRISSSFHIEKLECSEFEFSREIHDAEGTIGKIETHLLTKQS